MSKPSAPIVSFLSLVVAFASGCSAAAQDSPVQPSLEAEPIAPDDDCELVIRFQARCGVDPESTSSTCSDQRRLQCDAQRATQSEAYRQALLACIDRQTPCSADVEGCIFEHLARAEATSVQQTTRKAFCDRCKAAGESCARDFFITNAGSASQDAGLGFLLLTASDSVVASINDACARHMISSDCVSEFTSCMSTSMFLALPREPAECRSTKP